MKNASRANRCWRLCSCLACSCAALALAACSTDTQYPNEIVNQVLTLSSNLQTFQGRAYDGQGRWSPTNYDGHQGDGWWEKEQYPALAEAALSRIPNNSLSPGQRAVATNTVNMAISTHQLADGNFDGPAGTDAGVGGTQWAWVEGVIAVLLSGGVNPPNLATRTSWEQSLVKYVKYQETFSGVANWYANGNVNLNVTLTMYAAYKMAQNVGNTNDATAMLSDYQAEQAFIVNPPGWNSASWGTAPYGNGPGFGWHQVGSTGWFSETPRGTGPGNFWCNNGQSPCEGLDYEYTMAQMEVASWGYVITGRDAWWKNIVLSEAAVEQPRLIDGGTINASGGSRHNTSSTIFYPDVFSVMASNNLGGAWDTLWGQQQRAMLARFQYDNNSNTVIATLNANDFTMLANYAVGATDATTTMWP
jgi:hypothetical protein